MTPGMSKKDAQPELVPRLRFPEFRDAPAWVGGRCGDIADVLQGYGFPERYQGENRGLYPLYKVSDISAAFERGDKYIIEANNYIDQDVLSEIGAKSVPEGTTIFAKIGEAIRSNRRAIATRPSVIDNNVAGVKAISGKASDEFIYYLWSNISLIDFAGGVVPAISKSAIETIPVAYTEIEDEQQKIADCLGSLDDLIAAEGRKLTALRDHKQGLMQQLFPREGEAQPRLRFPGFQNAPDWDWKPLGEFADIKLGKMLDKNKHRSGHRLPYLNNLAVRWNDFHTSDLPEMYFDDDELEKYELTAGDVVVCEGGEPGRSAVWDERLPDMKFQKALHRVRFRIEFVPHLLVHYLETIAGTEAFESLFTGGGIKHLTRQTFALLPVPIASPDEQHRIADCLCALDARITAQSAKLDALRTHKRGLMQQLFPSPEDAV